MFILVPCSYSANVFGGVFCSAVSVLHIYSFNFKAGISSRNKHASMSVLGQAILVSISRVRLSGTLKLVFELKSQNYKLNQRVNVCMCMCEVSTKLQ